MNSCAEAPSRETRRRDRTSREGVQPASVAHDRRLDRGARARLRGDRASASRQPDLERRGRREPGIPAGRANRIQRLPVQRAARLQRHRARAFQPLHRRPARVPRFRRRPRTGGQGDGQGAQRPDLLSDSRSLARLERQARTDHPDQRLRHERHQADQPARRAEQRPGRLRDCDHGQQRPRQRLRSALPGRPQER